MAYNGNTLIDRIGVNDSRPTTYQKNAKHPVTGANLIDADKDNAVVVKTTDGLLLRNYDEIDLNFYAQTGGNDNSRLTSALKLIPDGGALNLFGRTIKLDNFSFTRAIRLYNGIVEQADASRPGFSIDLSGVSGFNIEWDIKVKCATGNIGGAALSNPDFAAFRVTTGANRFFFNNLVCKGAEKTGFWCFVSNNGTIGFKNPNFSQNGRQLRTTITRDINATEWIIPVASSAGFQIDYNAYIGDTRFKIIAINGNNITLENNGTRRVANENDNNILPEKFGQFFTHDKSGFNGLYIAESGGDIIIDGGVFNDNAWFGIFNRGFGGTYYLNSPVFDRNGYIGCGNGPKFSKMVAESVQANYNGNNGFDINQLVEATLNRPVTIGNGVDGLFVGGGRDVTINNPFSKNNHRIGLLIDADNNELGMQKLTISGGDISDNPLRNISCKLISNTTITKVRFKNSDTHMFFEGSNNKDNPTNISVIDNEFLDNGLSRDVFANIQGYKSGSPAGKIKTQNNRWSPGLNPKIEVYASDQSEFNPDFIAFNNGDTFNVTANQIFEIIWSMRSFKNTIAGTGDFPRTEVEVWFSDTISGVATTLNDMNITRGEEIRTFKINSHFTASPSKFADLGIACLMGNSKIGARYCNFKYKNILKYITINVSA